MPFVLDASIAACWAFADEDHPVAALALERMRMDVALVPSLWWFELRNTLIVSERRGRLTETDTALFSARNRPPADNGRPFSRRGGGAHARSPASAHGL